MNPEGGTQIQMRDVPVVHHTVGERAGWREIDPNDKTDIARLWETDSKNPGVKYIGGKSKNLGELKRWLRKIQRSKNSHVYAVTAEDESVPLEKRKEVEGWIRLDHGGEERDRYIRTMGEGGLPLKLSDDILVTETASLRRLDDVMPHGLISSARRQILLDMLRADMQNGLYSENEKGDITPKRIAAAYVDPQNEASIRSIVASGFVLVKSGAMWKADDDPIDVYRLDWKKLQEIEKEKTKSAFLDRLQSLFDKKIVPLND